MRFLTALIVLIGSFNTAHAEGLPTSEEVRAQIAANHAKLRHLHLQAHQTNFFTQAYRDYNLYLANNEKKNIEALSELPKDQVLNAAHNITAAYALSYLVEQEKQHRSASETLPSRPRYQHLEVFLSGENYQVRHPWDSEKDFSFPAVSPSSSNLASDFDRIPIHSWSSKQSPHATRWGGNLEQPVRRFDSHFSYHTLPPFLYPIQTSFESGWAYSHPFDVLQDRMIRSLDVIGYETIDQQDLLVVHAVVETDKDETYTLPDNTFAKRKQQFLVRAKLDLEHGAVPRQMEIWSWAEGVKSDKSESMLKYSPQYAASTQEIVELQNGGFYPTKTQFEYLQGAPADFPTDFDRAAPQGMARHFVTIAETWTIDVVKSIEPIDDKFFVLEFPKESRLWDEKLQRIAKSLEPQPPIAPGAPAPKLKIARWMDGKRHRLEDYRGEVVVLVFWKREDKTFEEFLPSLVQLQDRFEDQSVNFISIHPAEADTKKLQQRIREFTTEKNWNCLNGIDSGSMFDNSVTTAAYGVTSFPTMIVISPEGNVAYNDQIPSPEIADLIGKDCDDVTPEEERRLMTFVQNYFQEAGEPWPGEENITPEMNNRVRLFHLTKEIERVLPK